MATVGVKGLTITVISGN